MLSTRVSPSGLSLRSRAKPHAAVLTTRVARPVPTSRLRAVQDDVKDVDEECINLDQPIDVGKLIDAEGAGASFTSPGWLTQLGRLWGGKGDVPVADAKPEDIQDLLGGALFKALYKWMVETGPVYLLPTGPASSFLVISEPQAAKHVLRTSDNPSKPIYVKGLVAEVSEFLFGQGFAISGGEAWRVRRRAVGPSLHRGYLEVMIERVFDACSRQMVDKIDKQLDTSPGNQDQAIDMEAYFSQLTLDVIGKAVRILDSHGVRAWAASRDLHHQHRKELTCEVLWTIAGGAHAVTIDRQDPDVTCAQPLFGRCSTMTSTP